ncbi:response regulator [Ktedonosporobacter rubrisoli]|nr:response regulator [Ktedonosporobacter rubrisoli]
MKCQKNVDSVVVLDEEYMTPAFTRSQPYVLVADDDRDILAVIMLLLETEGYAGLGFADSRKVLPFLMQAEQGLEKDLRLPAVVLLDLMMPGISGYDIAAWLNMHPWGAHVPVIVMTADDRIHSASDIRGASDWLSKPFQIDVLLEKLERYLAPSRLP